MKKLGTPIGAGPGSDSEKVGVLGVGTPLPVGRVVGFPGLTTAGLRAGGACVVVCWGSDDGFCAWLGEAGDGAVDEPVVVELELDELDPDPELEVEGEVVVELDELLEEDAGVELDDVVVDDDVEELAGTHESVSDAMPVSGTGSGICDTGVPGATLSTVKV